MFNQLKAKVGAVTKVTPIKLPSPEQLGTVQTEHNQQVAVMAWAASQRSRHPELKWLFAIPNGGNRSPIEASRLKAEGVRAGVSDLMLPVAKGQYHGLFVEVKLVARKNHKQGGRSPEQVEFQAFAQEQGYAAITCYGWEHVTRAIEGYLKLEADPA